MAIKILKEGKRVVETYEGSCAKCGCEFEIPRYEAERRATFCLARPGEVLPPMYCPNCHTGPAALNLRTEVEGEPARWESGSSSISAVPLTPALSHGEREKEADAIVNTECGA